MNNMPKILYILVGLSMLSLDAFSQSFPSNTCPAGAQILTVGTSCSFIDYEVTGTYSNSGLNSGCGTVTNDDDGFFRFQATSPNITIDETSCNATNLGGNRQRRRVLAVYTGCTAGSLIACSESNTCVMNTLNLTGLTVGNFYNIQLDRTSGNSTATMKGQICIYETGDPDVAFPGQDLGTLSCTGTQNVTGTTSGANTDCTVSSAGDHIYQFTTTEITDIEIDLCASSYDTEIHIFDLANGSCNAGALSSNDDNCGTRSSLTLPCQAAGTYVVVIEGAFGNEGAYDMDINITNCGCPPTFNDDPCDAVELVTNTFCDKTTGDNTIATTSSVANPTCANYGGEDVWYYTVVPASGTVEIQTSGVPGGITDTGLATYDGSCNSINTPHLSCNDDYAGTFSGITETGLTPGDTLFIRVWEYGGNAFGEFNICAYDPTCSGLTTNDFCEDPATLTQNAMSSFSTSTASVFTADFPDNVASEFCGSIENNSWYQFTATATTESFPITSVTGCATGGIQAEVYSQTSFACCTGFTSVSNCFSPGTASTGTVTATGLTIGQNYMLMIDGFAGAFCDFTIGGWAAVGVLPIELAEFDAIPKIDRNLLKWVTKSEIDSKWIVIEKSLDGNQFEEIGRVNAAGNSSTEIEYEFEDYQIHHSIVYYRLKMIDVDLSEELSNINSVARSNENISIYPNPTNGIVSFDFLPEHIGEFQVSFTDVMGRKIIEHFTLEINSPSYETDVLKNLPKGMYFVEIKEKNGLILKTEKVIKE